MDAEQHLSQVLPENAWRLIELGETAAEAQTVQELANRVLPSLCELAHSPLGFMYVNDERLTAPYFFHHGLQYGMTGEIEYICAQQSPVRQVFEGSGENGKMPVRVSAPMHDGTTADLILYPMEPREGTGRSLVGLWPLQGDGFKADILNRVLHLLAITIDRLVEQEKHQKQISLLSTYMNVSSMIAQPLGLPELLETILYCCIELASAEEASILLLDEEKENFMFYLVQGESESLLKGSTFPADQGIAGYVLKTQVAEIINDVQADPRYYGKIDTQAGFKTRNMIVVPLTAGEEKIGILSVVNKEKGGSFTAEEHKFLLLIADEIAMAVRNAKVFEYLVNTYCKQRQGQNSCKGCKRPLGSWTPCVKYREASVVCECLKPGSMCRH